MLQNVNLTLSCLAKQGGEKCEPVGSVILLRVLDRQKTRLFGVFLVGFLWGFSFVVFLFRRKTSPVLIVSVWPVVVQNKFMLLVTNITVFREPCKVRHYG